MDCYCSTVMEGLMFYLVYFLCISWNISQVTPNSPDLQRATDIERLFCRGYSTTIFRRSFSNLPVKPPEFLHSACCLECSNNLTKCAFEGDCCLEAYDDLPTIDESKLRIEMECVYPQLKPYWRENVANNPYAIKMIQRCPHDATDYVEADVIAHCEKRKTNLVDVIPGTDPRSLYTYRNKYCALCHSIPEETLVYWSASVSCKYGDIQLRNLDDIIDDVSKSEYCNIVFKIPLEFENKIKTCFAVAYTTCNETGFWKMYDSFIERSCLAYTKIYDFAYRNVFCYMCNTNDVDAPSNCNRPPGMTVFYSFSALINPRPSEGDTSISGEEGRHCMRDEGFDPVMEQCLKVTCQFPKSLSDGVCENMVNDIGGAIFDVYFEMTPQDSVQANESIAYQIQTYLLSELLTFGLIEDHIAAETLAMTTGTFTPMTDVNKVSMMLVNVVYYVKIAFAKTYQVSIIDSILEMENMSIEFNSMNLTTKLSHWHRGSHFITDIRTCEILYTLYHTSTPDLTHLPMSQFSLRSEPTTYHLTKFSTCPFITINGDVVATNETTVGKVYILPLGISIDHRDVLIKSLNDTFSWNHTEFKNVSIHICKETYENIVRERGKVDNYYDEKDDVIIITSFICIVLSMLSAFCTFLVYCMLKELRTQPGINNMLLALYMFIAQALFQYGYGSSKDVSDVTCTIIGICLHFAWLAFAMWMNVCCIHTFRVFKSTTLHRRENDKLRVSSAYTIYCWLTASIPVVIQIVKSYVESEGEEFGYGGNICYISPVENVIYLVTIPIVCIVMIDMILYAAVVIQIKRASGNFEHKGETRNLMMVYLRLSTITGGTWIFAAVYVLTNAVWAEYFFVLFNASQGIFLFIAFVVNRRVYKLMTSLCLSATGTQLSSRLGNTTENKTDSSKARSQMSGKVSNITSKAIVSSEQNDMN